MPKRESIWMRRQKRRTDVGGDGILEDGKG